jgi:hypothetical protein
MNSTTSEDVDELVELGQLAWIWGYVCGALDVQPGLVPADLDILEAWERHNAEVAA